MTVSYQYKVASSTSGGFTRLLFMWRGSLYKLIYRELVIFLLAFDILSALYRNLMTDAQKQWVLLWVLCNSSHSSIILKDSTSRIENTRIWSQADPNKRGKWLISDMLKIWNYFPLMWSPVIVWRSESWHKIFRKARAHKVFPKFSFILL